MFRFLFILLIGFCCISFAVAQEPMEEEKVPPFQWDQFSILNIRDFKGQPVKEKVPFQSQGHYILEDNTNFIYFLFKRNLNKNIAVYFDPNDSWLQKKKGDIGQKLLYEQTVFNIHEVAARRLRKKYREHSRWKLVFGDAKEIKKEVVSDLNERLYNYRLTSYYGTGEFQQMKWGFNVKRDLRSLDDFAFESKIKKEEDREKRQQERKNKKALAKEKKDAKRAQRREERELKKEEKAIQKEEKLEAAAEEEIEE